MVRATVGIGILVDIIGLGRGVICVGESKYGVVEFVFDHMTLSSPLRHGDSSSYVSHGVASGVASVKMMPIGIPKVAYRIPGAQHADWVDIYNRMYRERIIFLGQEIDDEFANQIIGVMLFLDQEDSTKPIYLYINWYTWLWYIFSSHGCRNRNLLVCCTSSIDAL